MTTIADLTQELKRLMDYRTQLDVEHTTAKRAINQGIDRCRKDLQLATNGLEVDRIARARKHFYITGATYIYGRAGDTASMMQDAIDAISQGGRRLVYEYFGCKNYDRWTCQRSDHPYCMKPRHGTTVTEIGLTKETRDVMRENEDPLPPYVIEEILYVLYNFRQIYEAENPIQERPIHVGK